MDKIRLGNDIEMRWSIFTRDGDNKVPYDLEGRELTLSVVNRTGESEIEFFAKGNIVTGVFRGRDQKILGKHGVILRENNGGDGMRTVDACDAFELVACSCEEALGSPGTIQLFRLTFDTTIGAITGTIDPILNYEAEQAEAERKASEIVRKADEEQRIDNEKQRNADETLRKIAEEARAVDEQERKAGEDLREANEAARIASEEARSSAEAIRAAGEAARAEAETARREAEKARVDAEEAREEAEAARVKAEKARVEAESERQAKFAAALVQETGQDTDKVMSQKAVTDALEGKQDTIPDLEAIRQGAAKGSTALQSESDPVYLADKPSLALKSEIPDISGKVDKVEGKELSSNDYTDKEKAKLAGLQNYDDSEVRNLIAQKANDADLAEVAKTGKYEDLIGEPVVESPNQPTGGESVWVNPNEDTEEVEVYSRQQTDALIKTRQKELTLTVKDNGNIVIGNIMGQTKEFMPATPSGDPMHYAYVAAGAVWNGTGADITRIGRMTGDTIVHKAGYWYLNELGDISNEEMRKILIQGRNSECLSCFVSSIAQEIKLRTNLFPLRPPTYIGWLNIEAVVLYANPQSNDYTVSSSSYKSINVPVENNCRKILTIIDSKKFALSSTNKLKRLEFFKLKNMALSQYINSPYFREDCILYMIQNEAATSAITITLHADAYARAMASDEIVAALAEHPNVSLASA